MAGNPSRVLMTARGPPLRFPASAPSPVNEATCMLAATWPPQGHTRSADGSHTLSIFNKARLTRDGKKTLLHPRCQVSGDVPVAESPVIGQVKSAQANFVKVTIESAAPARGGTGEQETAPRELLCVVRGLLKKIKQTVLVGDRVRVVGIDWTDGRGMVEEVLPRATEFPDPPVANVDQVLLVFAVSRPPFDPQAATRFLVASEAAGIPVLVVLNKADLVSPNELQGIVSQVEGWGYTTLPISASTGAGLPRLATHLSGRVSVVVGPSGVGKSSLINALKVAAATDALPLADMPLSADACVHFPATADVPSPASLAEDHSPATAEIHSPAILPEEHSPATADVHSPATPAEPQSSATPPEPHSSATPAGPYTSATPADSRSSGAAAEPHHTAAPDVHTSATAGRLSPAAAAGDPSPGTSVTSTPQRHGAPPEGDNAPVGVGDRVSALAVHARKIGRDSLAITGERSNAFDGGSVPEGHHESSSLASPLTALWEDPASSREHDEGDVEFGSEDVRALNGRSHMVSNPRPPSLSLPSVVELTDRLRPGETGEKPDWGGSGGEDENRTGVNRPGTGEGEVPIGAGDDEKPWSANGVDGMAGRSGVGDGDGDSETRAGMHLAMVDGVTLEAVGNLSQIGRGKHTTRHVSLINVAGGLLADSPGFNQPDLDGIVTAAELPSCFPEIRDRLGECAFSNCQHLSEPGCAVREGWARQPWYALLHAEVKDLDDVARWRAASKTRREGTVRYKSRAGGVRVQEALLDPKKNRRVSRRQVKQRTKELLDEAEEKPNDEE